MHCRIVVAVKGWYWVKLILDLAQQKLSVAQFRDGGCGGGLHHYNHNQIGVLCAQKWAIDAIGPIFEYWFLSFIIRGFLRCACVLYVCLHRLRVKINYDKKNDYTNDASQTT